MLRRIEADDPAVERTGLGALVARESEPVVAPPALTADTEMELLPHGHPKWVRDGVSISQRAREIIAHLRPIAVRVLRFWDHQLRSIVIGGRRVRVDPSGSYRVE